MLAAAIDWSAFMTSAMLRVPGASLYYQVSGQGPLLVLSAGGAGDADALAGLRPALEQRYTVLSYDRRGYARSPLDAPSDTAVIPVETAGDDLHRLLAAVATDPVTLVGVSLGALIGVELLARHPEQVRRLVAHEPPAHVLVPESERPPLPDATDPASLSKYAAAIGVKPVPPPASLPPEALARMAANGKHFVSREAPSARSYVPDLARLRAVATKLVLAGGEDGHPFVAYRCAAKLAEHLGLVVTEFPGSHAGASQQTTRFAARLLEVLTG
jgi:pimeloyl-ACP methyl ester carboxylesterase